MRFPSKKDAWLVLVLLAAGALFLASAAWLFWTQNALLGLVHFAILGLVASLVMPMYYEVGREELLVRSGWLRWRIPLKEIVRVTPSRNPLSSPAMSLDRLQVEYLHGAGATRSILISPADQHSFLVALRSAEPALQLSRDGLERRS